VIETATDNVPALVCACRYAVQLPNATAAYVAAAMQQRTNPVRNA